jgi:hypothetical protein
MQGIPRDYKTPFTELKKCYECGESFHKDETLKSGKVVTLKIFNDPWASSPCTVRVHSANNEGQHGTCLDKLTDTSWADFRYFLCDECCNRLIISQCPSNGWRSYKQIDNAGRDICVKCYQDNILENGHDADDLKRNNIPGDFYNESDISINNWSLVQGMSDCRIAGSESAENFMAKARELAAVGNKVLINYGAMGIGGGEGYVSLYIKSDKIEE